LEKNLSRFSQRFSDDRRLRIGILIAAGLAVLLLMLSELLPQKDTDKAAAYPSNQEYLSAIENSITQLVGTIDGVGTAKVMVTLETGTEYVYAFEEDRDSDRLAQSDGTKQTDNLSRKYIIIQNRDGSQEAVLQTTRLPAVRGVVVVCEGGRNAAVAARVTQAVAVALDLDYHQIYVTGMSDQQEEHP